MAYYILVKEKGSKTWTGAIPARAGVSKAKLVKAVSKSLRKGLTYRIVDSTTFKKGIMPKKPKRRIVRKKKK